MSLNDTSGITTRGRRSLFKWMQYEPKSVHKVSDIKLQSCVVSRKYEIFLQINEMCITPTNLICGSATKATLSFIEISDTVDVSVEVTNPRVCWLK